MHSSAKLRSVLYPYFLIKIFVSSGKRGCFFRSILNIIIEDTEEKKRSIQLTKVVLI